MLGAGMALSLPKAWGMWGEGILDGSILFAGSMCSPEGQVNYAEQADIVTFDEKTQEWVLNGEKAFCSGGTAADKIAIYGLMNGDMHIFALDPWNTPGLTTHHNPEFGNAPAFASYTMNNVRVPKDMGSLIGKDALGAVINRKTVENLAPMGKAFALGCGALALGAASAAFDKTLEYLTHRTYNFKPIASLPNCQYKLAVMGSRLAAARALLYEAASLIEHNHKDSIMVASFAKPFVCDTARYIADECVQMHGCVGINPESGVSRHLTDTVGFSIGVGTSDLHYMNAAKAMGLPCDEDSVFFPL
jgi:butyryl-CoA dehydrogenase